LIKFFIVSLCQLFALVPPGRESFLSLRSETHCSKLCYCLIRTAAKKSTYDDDDDNASTV